MSSGGAKEIRTGDLPQLGGLVEPPAEQQLHGPVLGPVSEKAAPEAVSEKAAPEAVSEKAAQEPAAGGIDQSSNSDRNDQWYCCHTHAAARADG